MPRSFRPTIRSWWSAVGGPAYPDATELLITADAGGSNGCRLRLWKKELAALADAAGLAITVCLTRLLSTPRAPIVLAWWMPILSVSLVVVVCLVAAWLPYWRVCRIDPACVLR